MFTSHYNIILRLAKKFAWKAVTGSALTAELGRSFQRGITSRKKENLYASIGASKDMSELMRMI